MAFLKRLIPLLLPILLSGGCYSDYDFDDRTAPVVCLNSDITPGDTIRVQVTRTRAWSEDNPYYSSSDFYIDIKDADVRLYVNGVFVEKLRRGLFQWGWGLTLYGEPLYGYVADYIPKAGDEIRIEADTPLYGSAWGEVTIPQPVVIEGVDATVIGLKESTREPTESSPCDRNYSMTLDLYARFTDPLSTTDYYKLDASCTRAIYPSISDESSSGKSMGSRPDAGSRAPGTRLQIIGPTPDGNGNEPIAYVWNASFDFSGEPLLTEQVSVLESLFSETSGYTVFSDRQISGKTYPLHIIVKNLEIDLTTPLDRPVYDTLTVNVTLSRISPSYYRYMMSVWAANDGLAGSLGDFGLSAPVFPASNVSTGAGVVSASTPFTFRLPLIPLITSHSSPN